MTAPDYVGFARWVIQEGWDGSSLDDGDIQDAAVRFGIIKQVSYCPEEHGDNDGDVERGDEWFVFVKAAT